MSRRWGLLALVFLGILISYVDRGNLSIAAESIMRDFRLTPASMGVLLSAFFWTYALFQIPAGLMVDKFGIRVVYASGFLIWSLASAGMALSRGPGDILGLRLVLGLAESVGPLASLAFIRQNFEGPAQGSASIDLHSGTDNRTCVRGFAWLHAAGGFRLARHVRGDRVGSLALGSVLGSFRPQTASCETGC